MIQFCEDCGQKNILDLTQIKQGQAVFKCRACDYHNCFHIKIEKKNYSEKLLELCETVGVALYVLVDQTGNVTAHNIKNPDSTAQILLSCAKNSFAIVNPDIKYVVFPEQNQKKFFIFKTGNLFLGVIKEQNISDTALTENLLFFLKDLNIGRNS
jgi:hypothetical protein